MVFSLIVSEGLAARWSREPAHGIQVVLGFTRSSFASRYVIHAACGRMVK